MSSRGSNAWMLEHWGQPCRPQLITVEIYPGGPKFQIDKRCKGAFEQLGMVFVRHGYIVRRAGGYNCRANTSNPKLFSNHAWATAGDFNDDTNPYRRDKLVTDMPREMIDDILEIKTVDGVRVFRCGADWDGDPLTAQSSYDAMHMEVIATPEELEAGFPAHAPELTIVKRTEPSPAHYPVLRVGAEGTAVATLQQLLGMERLGNGAGKFGPRTLATVTAYQKSRGLKADGIVGPATWTSLLSHQPPLPAGSPPPQRIAA